MGASGRRWAAAGLGLVAIAAGLGCWCGSWWMAALLFKPAASGPPPDGSPPGLGLLEWAGRVQALQVGGLLLVVFGLIAWLLALNHWLWEGGRGAVNDRPGEATRPRFVEED